MDIRCFLTRLMAITLVLTIMDGIYLGIISKTFYNRQIEAIQGLPLSIKWGAAVFTYLLMVCACMIVVYKTGNYRWAFLWGGIAGLLIYGIYNGTNLATFRNYTVQTAFSDTAWGILLMGVASGIGGLVC